LFKPSTSWLEKFRKYKKEMIDRTKSPLIKDAIEFNLKLKPYEKFVLNNGVEVYAIDAGAEEVLQIEMVFYAGNNFETANGIAAQPIICFEMELLPKPLSR
jgi:hypothetical protein